MNARQSIRRYRLAGHMFGQTFHSGTAPTETPAARALVCAMLTVERWFADRNRHAHGGRYGRECVREAIAELRALRKSTPGGPSEPPPVPKISEGPSDGRS